MLAFAHGFLGLFAPCVTVCNYGKPFKSHSFENLGIDDGLRLNNLVCRKKNRITHVITNK